jgi:hypothetical protein
MCHALPLWHLAADQAAAVKVQAEPEPKNKTTKSVRIKETFRFHKGSEAADNA